MRGREGWINGALAAALLIVPLALHLAGEVYYVNLASRVVIVALAAVGLNLALGYGGMVSFGHAAFFGIGGYVAGISAHHAILGTSFLGLSTTTEMPLIWLISVLLAGVVALAIGAISLRTKGVYFIMITLAFAQMLYYFAISFPAYGGEDGLPIYVRNTFPGLNTFDPITFYGICVVALFACLFLTARIMGSRFGAALDMAHLSETRLATAGIAPFNIRLTAFVISAMMTALAGALFADLNGFVSPSMMSWHRSGEIMVIVILGGVGRLWGPVAGAIAFVLLETFLGGLTERWGLFLGLILLGTVLFARGGIMGLIAGKARHD
ncbi:branched-chain amino acid transport system permease protein [Rubricella aquisinus]|uniref:Branched-chain amino acid transport system permease protein n=1 Tax=Rubricella aquisinus TaxID=2028108 RepID=A0A840WPQ2_9RHOB|nr:branched-chain amino acid ABC transporter permease [Rubricella aquisinus]MBB5517028.1 branched-chain amino acid transport system permease protein [Rubricella aquisinus]